MEQSHLSTRLFEITLTANTNTSYQKHLAFGFLERDTGFSPSRRPACVRWRAPWFKWAGGEQKWTSLNTAGTAMPLSFALQNLISKWPAAGSAHTYHSLFPTSPLPCNLLIAKNSNN